MSMYNMAVYTWLLSEVVQVQLGQGRAQLSSTACHGLRDGVRAPH